MEQISEKWDKTASLLFSQLHLLSHWYSRFNKSCSMDSPASSTLSCYVPKQTNASLESGTKLLASHIYSHAVAQLVEALRYKLEGRSFYSRWCLWNFSLTLPFRPRCGPGVDSAFNRNEYQEYLLGVKPAGAYGWQPYQIHVPILFKSGSLDLLELQGTALLFT